ncbi:MAG TPA: DUF1501 domain-containing protein [Gemmataceae bacterium]|nr:DUF1501 domain-containing protein [Gemmataceae bacterium]
MLHRRDAMMRLGQLGLGALGLPGLLEAGQAHSSPRQFSRNRAKSCIQVFLWGGPPQQDMWDLKPDAPSGIRSEFRPIHTAVPGISLCEHMPRLARHMDKAAVIRSLTHPSTVHEPSVYHMLTGKQDPSLIVPRNQRQRTNFPNLASVVSYYTRPGTMPASVTIPRPIGHDGVTYAGTYAGWLGPQHDPMELREAPNSRTQPLHPVSLPPDMNATRLQARHGLLNMIEGQERRLQHRATHSLGGFYERAFRMLSSSAAKRAFDLDREPAAVRDRYGRNEYGEGLLLARRLVEAGVRLVSMIWMYVFDNGRVSNVWDNHTGYLIHGSRTGFDLLRSPVCIPPLDQGLSALLEDLSVRGLLDETLVVAVGEFGRTPRINNTGGRDHWGRCQSAFLAGGGIRGGQVYGASDPIAAYPRDNPVSPEDLLATIYHSLGVPAAAEIHDRENRPQRMCDGRPVLALFQ